MRLLISTLIIALLALSSRCGPTEPVAPERQPGTLEYYGDSVRVHVPDTVTAGAAFEVRVTTYGGGCMQKGETDVYVRGRTAEIRPYDYEPTDSGQTCPAILVLYNHTATVTFAEPGEATVRIHGWKKPENTFLTVSRSTIVRPGPSR